MLMQIATTVLPLWAPGEMWFDPKSSKKTGNSLTFYVCKKKQKNLCKKHVISEFLELGEKSGKTREKVRENDFPKPVATLPDEEE